MSEPNITWNQLASVFAAEAYIKHSGRRFGVWFVKELGVVVAFENAPKLVRRLRTQTTWHFYAALFAAGVAPLAQASFPAAPAANAGVTYVCVVAATEELRAAVENMWASAALAALNEASSSQEGE